VRDVDAPVVQPLLAMPADRVVVFADSPPLWRRVQCAAYDHTTRRRRDVHDDEQAAQLAQLLEARYLVSLPLRSPNETVGFIHLVCRTARYGATDVDFLAQAAAQAGLMIENMTLVDRLAKERARQERTKISRDLHDGTIQPYIGLKLALEALQRKVGHDPLLAHEVSELTKMASDGISELRLYVGTLKSRSDREQRLALLPAIRVQAEKFSDYCGISTGVTGDGDISVTAALFDEVMHIVREALSNIRRHTQARHASIHVSVREGVLALQFSNDAGGGAAPGEFFPRCIGERAKELAGRVNVGRLPDGRTVVAVELPV
jgi:signal transduction histidine kinase